MTSTNRNGNSPATLSEKGLLTPGNCVLALIDYQPQMIFGVANMDRQLLINNAVGLAKSAVLFDVPVILSTVETLAFSGATTPHLVAALPNVSPIERTTMNAWDDANFVAAVEATGRKKLILAGLWTEACITFPTVQAIHDGYDVYVIADACGDVSEVAQEMSMQRMIQAGAKPMTWLQVLLELQRDWALRGTYDGVMDIVKQHAGAYGAGVEYAYTMVHRAPPTKYPEYKPATAATHA